MIAPVIFLIGLAGFVLSISVSGTRYQGPYGIWVMFLFMILASGMYLFSRQLRLQQRPKLKYGLWAVLGVLVVMGLINAQIHADRLGPQTVTAEVDEETGLSILVPNTYHLKPENRFEALLVGLTTFTVPPRHCIVYSPNDRLIVVFSQNNAVVTFRPRYGTRQAFGLDVLLPHECQ